MKLYPEVLNSKTKKALKALSRLEFIPQFYLAGGTGLALQLGHRFSQDLDFFSPKKFNEDEIIKQLSTLKNFQLYIRDKGTIIGFLNKVKISFFLYEYNLLEDLLKFENINLAHYLDIACMKISALNSRGTKRDFIDLYFVLKLINLKNLLKKFKKKYKGIKFNLFHLKKSLIYFEDAENEPMPKMIKKVNWEEIKKFFINEVKSLIF